MSDDLPRRIERAVYDRPLRAILTTLAERLDAHAARLDTLERLDDLYSDPARPEPEADVVRGYGTRNTADRLRRGDVLAVLDEHLAQLPNYACPDRPVSDLVEQGYGNALCNVRAAVAALSAKAVGTVEVEHGDPRYSTITLGFNSLGNLVLTQGPDIVAVQCDSIPEFAAALSRLGVGAGEDRTHIGNAQASDFRQAVEQFDASITVGTPDLPTEGGEA